MPSKKKKKKKHELTEAEMDLTPMIDVVFLLIIFFLCLEFKTLEGRLSANLPKDVGVNTSPAEPIEKLDIRISNIDWGQEVRDKWDPRRIELKNHKCQWQVNAMVKKTLKGLEDLLKKEVDIKVTDNLTGRKKPRPITIKTGPGVTYGDVTMVIDIARNANFEEITFGGGEGTKKRPNAK